MEKTLGNYIAELRKKNGMTQAELAEKLGMGQDQVSRWESGKIKPNKESMAKIKEILS